MLCHRLQPVIRGFPGDLTGGLPNLLSSVGIAVRTGASHAGASSSHIEPDKAGTGLEQKETKATKEAGTESLVRFAVRTRR
jgi:hypothetical protein